MILYKYFTPERIDVLENARIRYTQPVVFNDPFESRPFVEKLPIEEAERYAEADIKAGKYTESNWLSFERMLESPENAEMVTLFMNTIFYFFYGGVTGILSLTEKPDNLLMWAHYARSHEGFVIGFDMQHEHFARRMGIEDGLYQLRKVEYSTKRIKMSKQLSEADLYFVKSIEWEYEQEWRDIRPIFEAAQEIESEPVPIFLFDLPPSSIQSVILGCRASRESEQHIRRIIGLKPEYRHTRLFKAEVHTNEFRVVISEHAA